MNLICWPVLVVGWRKGWVTKLDIADYAASLLSTDSDKENEDEDVILLASANFLQDEEVEELLIKVAGSYAEKEALGKWRLMHLVSLSSSSLSDQEKIDKLQILYADFDYPEDMKSCSIYSQDEVDPLEALSKVILKLEKDQK